MRNASAIFVSALIFQSCAFAQDAAKYSIKDGNLPTGSALRRSVATLHLPPDKGYAQLSAEEKELVKSNYENLGPDDEPPYPIAGTKAIYKGIGDAHQLVQASGKLSMVVTVGVDGKPSNVSVYSSPDSRLTQVVASILMLQKFKPARCQGKPCVMEFPVDINLELE
jgi:hypothetical protein